MCLLTDRLRLRPYEVKFTSNQHNVDLNYQSCGVPETTEHFLFECKEYEEQRKLLVTKLKENWKEFNEQKALQREDTYFWPRAPARKRGEKGSRRTNTKEAVAVPSRVRTGGVNASPPSLVCATRGCAGQTSKLHPTRLQGTWPEGWLGRSLFGAHLHSPSPPNERELRLKRVSGCIHTCTHTYIHTYRQTDRQTDRHTCM